MLFQPGKAIGKKALAPKRDHLTAGIQTRCDVVVGHAFGCVEDHLGSLNLKIRQRIFCRPPA
jgi:hypothetical protein